MTTSTRKLAKIKEAGERLPVEFDPARHRLKIAATDYTIEEAKRIKDWPTLEAAVDAKIEEQRKFVGWWGVTIRSQGEARKKENRVLGFLSVPEAEDLTGMKQQRVSDLGTRLDDVDDYRQRLLGASYRAAMLEGAGSQLNQQSLSPEHYTPARYIEAARAVLGGIDLDPASCAQANATVGAAEYYDVHSNGLDREWRGRIWLNPPYGSLVGKFIAKLEHEIIKKRVTASIVLVNAHCTDTAWFRPLWNGLLCFTDHRVNFTGDDTRSGSTHGSVFGYRGPKEEDFIREFRQFGPVVARVDDGGDL
jgi:ParB family chromosome partitioning protein